LNSAFSSRAFQDGGSDAACLWVFAFPFFFYRMVVNFWIVRTLKGIGIMDVDPVYESLPGFVR
jgi:hypothetical protein